MQVGPTVEALAELRVVLKVFRVSDHAVSQICDGQQLLLLLEFRSLSHGFHVGIHRVLHLFHALLAQFHFLLECFELISCVRLDLSSHSFTRPLLEAIEFLVDNHFE